ncbi:neurogenic locus notch -like protein, partial [Brachionus plicatilis]
MALVTVVKDQSKTIEAIKTELAEAKKNQTGGMEASWSAIVNGKKQSEQTQVLIASVNKEINDKARIENNVVISGVGVGDEEEDEEKVEVVLKALKLDRSKTVKRFRRIRNNKSNENRSKKELDMILVEFKEESSKQTALRNAKNLRGTEDLKKVYINPDKTPSERALERELRTERNKRND